MVRKWYDNGLDKICLKRDLISLYQGKFSCQSMVRLVNRTSDGVSQTQKRRGVGDPGLRDLDVPGSQKPETACRNGRTTRMAIPTECPDGGHCPSHSNSCGNTSFKRWKTRRHPAQASTAIIRVRPSSEAQNGIRDKIGEELPLLEIQQALGTRNDRKIHLPRLQRCHQAAGPDHRTDFGRGGIGSPDSVRHNTLTTTSS